MRRLGSGTIVLTAVALALTAGTAAAAAPAAAAAYCRAHGGTVEARTAAFGTNDGRPIRLGAAVAFCEFHRSSDDTSIAVDLTTLAATRPTLAVLAYLERPRLVNGTPGANPSAVYCAQLGGTDSFGSVSASGGGWLRARETGGGLDMCVFPDRSMIDAWGLTYHAGNVVRGRDLTRIFRYRASSPPPIYS